MCRIWLFVLLFVYKCVLDLFLELKVLIYLYLEQYDVCASSLFLLVARLLRNICVRIHVQNSQNCEVFTVISGACLLLVCVCAFRFLLYLF